MNFNTLGYMAQPIRSLRSVDPTRCAKPYTSPCLGDGVKHHEHLWDFGTEQQFWCPGVDGDDWPDDTAPDWMTTFPPLEEVDHDGVGRE
jgi:hypothetical protein